MDMGMALSGRRTILAIALLGMTASPTAARAPGDAGKPRPEAASAWPMQLWARVSYAPTAFPSEGSNHLFYELYLTNFSRDPVTLTGIDVVDPAAPGGPPLASFAGPALDAIAQPIGSDASAAQGAQRIPAGGTLVLFVDVAIPAGRRVPRQLAHRLRLGETVVSAAPIDLATAALKILGPPVRGADWLAADGPGNDPDNHHRRGIFIRDGRLTDSRRFAIDWKIVRDGRSYRGDQHLAASYFAYGQPLYAVADGVVITAIDGNPDNPPGHGADFRPAAPITIDNVGGNHVVLDLGNGQYAHYFHMRPGSLRVKPGDRVRKGQLIGAIGASGDAREPHVHLEITTSPMPLAGEGLPYVIDRYRVTASPGGRTGVRERQLPLDKMVVDFGR